MAKEQVTKEGEKVIVKKKGGCGTFIAGFFFAIIFMILTIGGAGAYVYFCVNLQQVESMFGVKLPVEGDINKKTIKDLIALGLDLKDSYVHMTVGEVETKVGITLPKKIPGTEIDISYLYEDGTTIEFLGKTSNIKDIEVMDAANNLNQFVDGVLDVVYDHVTVGEILETADLTQTITDMGYPALVDPIYTVRATSTKKKLSDLTINQAKDVLVDYYGADNFTVAKLIEASGTTLVPADAMYDDLRALKVQKVTTDDLLNSVTGEILNDLIDLTDFDFTQTAEFNHTNLNGMVDYVNNLYIGDFITLANIVDEDFFTDNFEFSTLKNTFVSKLDEAILSLKINQILTADQLTRTTVILNDTQKGMTVKELLTSTGANLYSIFGETVINEVGGYIKELQLVLANQWEEKYAELTWAKKLGLDGSSTALLDISSLTIGDVATSEDIPNTIFEKLGTLGNIMGDTDNPILSLIARIQLSDLFTKGGDVITQALEYDEADNLVTLATLLNITSTNGINGIISGITVKSLLDTPDTAITAALKSSSSTLGELLGMSTSPTGINKIISGITVGTLFTTPDTAIKNALSGSTDTLGQLLGVDTTTETMANYVLRNLTVADLFGSDPSAKITSVINGMHLNLIVPTPTGVLAHVTNWNTLTVGTLEDINIDVTSMTLADMVDEGLIKQSVLESKGIVISDTNPKWAAIKDMSIVDIIKAYYDAIS